MNRRGFLASLLATPIAVAAARWLPAPVRYVRQWTITTADYVLELDEYEARILAPAMAKLSAKLDADIEDAFA